MVAFAAFVGVFATTPGQTVGVSSFIDPIAAELGMVRERVLMLYSVGTFLGILTAPSVGRLVDRFGPRRLVVPAALAVMGACALMSIASGPWSLGMGFVALRASAIAGLSLVSTQMINLWFDRFRGRVTAVTLMGLALGGSLIPPLAETMMRADSWRAAYLALGAGVACLMVPVGLAFYRNRPEEDGHEKDFGWRRPPHSTTRDGGYTLRQASRTIVFWYLVALTLLVNAVNTALLLDHMRAMQAAGLGRDMGIALLGVVTTSQAISTLVSGVLVDRFGARPIGLLGLAILATSVICLMTMPALAQGLAYAIPLGAMIGMLQVSHSSGLGETFGTAHLGSIRGATFVIGVTGAALGPLPLLWSPFVAYWLFLLLTVGGSVLGISSLRHRSPIHA